MEWVEEKPTRSHWKSKYTCQIGDMRIAIMQRNAGITWDIYIRGEKDRIDCNEAFRCESAEEAKEKAIRFAQLYVKRQLRIANRKAKIWKERKKEIGGVS